MRYPARPAADPSRPLPDGARSMGSTRACGADGSAGPYLAQQYRARAAVVRIGRGAAPPAMLRRQTRRTRAHARGGRMVRLLLKLRYLAIVVSICGALHALAFIALGVIRGFEGYRAIFQGSHAGELPG